MRRPFRLVDVFTATPYRGNPVAVVHDAGGLSTDEMQRVAHWMNLSETTFVLPPDDATIEHVAALLGIDQAEIEAAEWVDNGPGWVAVLLGSVDRVLELRPGPIDMDVGVVALHPSGGPHALEVRAFFPKDGLAVEDPVTGSLNASVAQWLLGTGRLTAPYAARQGTALGRTGRVEISQDGDGAIWVGGGTVTCVTGEVEL